jgi:ABC-type transport system involved in cytochrome c biogenesis permease subunit
LLRNNGAALLALAAAALLVAGLGLALLWAPEDADQGISQKIFYVHVPVALTSYAAFGWATTSRATPPYTWASSSAS